MSPLPPTSDFFQKLQPSAIRLALQEYQQRPDADQVVALNAAIGNVSLPTHPAMQKRLFSLNSGNSPFKTGVIQYTATNGLPETRQAFLNLIQASGFNTRDLTCLITDGSSAAMELMILGVCNDKNRRPLLTLDPTYTNYLNFAARTKRRLISVTRQLQPDGRFTLLSLEKIESVIKAEKPAGLLVIPYDNPSGQLITQKTLIDLARLCVKYNLWLISDEAYRGLQYLGSRIVSIWGITEKQVPGIKGRRISLDSGSKLFNACGLRIGALVSDNREFIEKATFAYNPNLCANAIGQWIFASLAELPPHELRQWLRSLSGYYQTMIRSVEKSFKKTLPGIIVSRPQAAIYSVIDVRQLVDRRFNSTDFVAWCARTGKVKHQKTFYTLLVAPMADFYSDSSPDNPGRTQMRIAYVLSQEEMLLVPEIFSQLLKTYLNAR